MTPLSPLTETDIQPAILRGERDLRGGTPEPTQRTIAGWAKIAPSRYTELRKAGPPRSRARTIGRRTPDALHIARELARIFRVPLASMLLGRSAAEYHAGGGDIALRLARTADEPREQSLRLAALGMMLGESPDEIAGRIGALMNARGREQGALDEETIREMAAGGLGLGFVEVLASDDTDELQAPALAVELEEALATVAPEGRAPGVRVVKNLSHPDFSHDTIAPHLVALVAHRLLASFIARVPSVYRIGLAGGVHCEAFVRAVSGASTPFPDPSGDKQLTFVPLTLEPFRSHSLPISDAVVAQMASVARSLLGARRVEARTFQSFGYLLDNRIEELDTVAIGLVRDEYQRLDVAIYGCGDRQTNGWLAHILRGVKVGSGNDAATDVCLNLLSGDARPIPLPGGREFVGVGLEDIRRLAAERADGQKLALLLTSGPSKGLPISIVARAGLAGAVVCDERAARSAIAAIESRQGE